MLLDVDDGGPIFAFPAFTLHPEFTVRVYTDEVHPAYGGFTFGSGIAIWNNTRPDLAELRDSMALSLASAATNPGLDATEPATTKHAYHWRPNIASDNLYLPIYYCEESIGIRL